MQHFSTVMSRGGSVLFFLCFAIFWSSFTLVFDGVTGWATVRQMRAKGYPTVPGRITHSEVKEHSDSDGSTYSAEIRYTYRVDQREYRGDRYRYGGVSSSDGNAQRTVAAFPVGAEVTVHYHPRDPADAILIVGLEGCDLFMPMFLLPFNVVMLGLWIGLGGAAIRRMRRSATGGARVRDDGALVRIRFSGWRPVYTGAMAAAAIAFVGVFVIGFTAGFHPPLPAMFAAWGVILGGAIAAGLADRWKRGIQRDIVFDPFHQTLVLPRTPQRPAEVVVPVDRISAMEVEEVSSTRSQENPTSRYYLKVVFAGDDGSLRHERLGEAWDASSAQDLAAWFRQRLRLGQSR